MAVKPHPTTPGAWLIDWWVPDTGKPINQKTGKYPLKRHYETYAGDYDGAVARWSTLCQAHQSTHRIIGNPRLNDVIPDYLQFVELNKSQGYYKSVVQAMKKIKPFFGRHPVSHITFDRIEEFKRQHRATPRHANQCLEYLKVMINWMVSQNKAQPLPFKIVLLKYTERIAQPPSPDEFELILDTIRENFRKSGTTIEQRALQEAMIWTIYTTGLRFVEVRNLRWENLRWSDGRCLVAVTKTGVQRYCLLPPEALALLRPYSVEKIAGSEKKKRGPIFINPATGKPYTSIRRLLKNAADQHGIPMRGAHDLRHAAGTDTLEATGDLRATGDLLGHSTLKSTMRYTKISLRRQQRIAEQVAAFRKQTIEEEKARRQQIGEQTKNNR
jgi:integrase